ncbi:ATP-binding cassette domain-containing protein [Psychromonas algicola]|uniref:ATP-binding cassette domain-containing protein n=1 Tax=Psychromonas algicola TaxID=2555642 RepID=UPI001067BEED|nr:ATP-binding cassette domain-containing protein [Psychromonas sp. RZ5]TEW51728.1 ATP-binding cassette domain-containing protein [Psychromonas sp. RZ5]
MREVEKGMQLNSTLITKLLSLLGRDVEECILKQACEKTTKNLPKVRPVEWLQSALISADIKDVKVIQVGWRRFDQRLLPALIHYQEKWMIAQREEAGNISLTDANGELNLVSEEALHDSVVLLCRVAAKKKQSHFKFKDNKAAALVWREMFSESAWVWKVAVATIIINVLAVATSLFALQVYDRVVPTQAYATLTTLVVGMLLIISLDWSLKTIRARIVDSMAAAVDKKTSQHLFDHLLHLQLDLQPRSLGSLAAQVNGLTAVRQFLSSALILSLIDLPFALMFIGFIAVIGGQIGFVYLALLPIAILLGYVTQRRLRGLMYEQLMRENERQGILVDAIRGAESIRANNAGWRFSQQWQEINQSISRYNVQQKAISNFSSVTTTSLSTIAYVSALVVGVFLIGGGHLTMGALIACSILGGRVIAPIAQGVQHLSQWQSASQALNMANNVLMLNKERNDQQHLLSPEELPETLEVEGLRFAYPESPIQQVNIPKLSFKSGDRVLLLGAVGCGKSSLLKILAGLHRPSEGRVKLGMADLWEMEPQTVSSHLSYLPQSVHLFKGTLRSNLALSGTSTDSRLLKITHDLGIDAIAATSPMGMELPISEGGVGLSGGQQQLVALARMVINQPRIWILDEPTASLDVDSEAKVWQVLKDNVQPDDIVIVATHKPKHALAWVNRVVVMNEGTVLKDGKPENVLPQMQTRFQNKPIQQSSSISGRKFPDVI